VTEPGFCTRFIERVKSQPLAANSVLAPWSYRPRGCVEVDGESARCRVDSLVEHSDVVMDDARSGRCSRVAQLGDLSSSESRDKKQETRDEQVAKGHGASERTE